MPIATSGVTYTSEFYAKSKLNMINNGLLAIGEVPLPAGLNIDELQLGVDADISRRTVEATMMEIQAQGWYFNTDYDFKIYKDKDSFISLPSTLLRLDSYDDNQYVQKGDRVYDLLNQTYVIGPDYLEFDTIWYVDYDKLPVEAYEYISARAARKFQEQVIGAADLTNATNLNEQQTFINLQRRQLQTQAYNIQNPRVSTRVSNGYLRRGLYGITTRRY